MAFEVQRARRLLHEGAPLIRTLRGRAAFAVAAFVAGGRAALSSDRAGGLRSARVASASWDRARGPTSWRPRCSAGGTGERPARDNAGRRGGLSSVRGRDPGARWELLLRHPAAAGAQAKGDVRGIRIRAPASTTSATATSRRHASLRCSAPPEAQLETPDGGSADARAGRRRAPLCAAARRALDLFAGVEMDVRGGDLRELRGARDVLPPGRGLDRTSLAGDLRHLGPRARRAAGGRPRRRDAADEHPPGCARGSRPRSGLPARRRT